MEKSSRKSRVRLRWRRLATLLIAAYLMYWTGVSIHHIVVISHDTTALNQKIALTRAKNRVLTTDIHELDNRGDLKGMLTGKIPFPNPTSP